MSGVRAGNPARRRSPSGPDSLETAAVSAHHGLYETVCQDVAARRIRCRFWLLSGAVLCFLFKRRFPFF